MVVFKENKDLSKEIDKLKKEADKVLEFFKESFIGTMNNEEVHFAGYTYKECKEKENEHKANEEKLEKEKAAEWQRKLVEREKAIKEKHLGFLHVDSFLPGE